ncbi:MAG: D-alanyl-D-alanine carboxypeptidase [Peptococcaceae bacterium]|jgi:D-alanyl-D-alanine carboxypeptidase (penicillin-binding protein 5/6)|nr:D-alanyl-D-alanine carboxypeptidase [Peptococcaceae bacterium]
MRSSPAAVLAVVSMLFCTPPGAWAAGDPAPALQTTARAAALVEAHTGRELFLKDAVQRLPMASVTKLMTLLLAVEAVEHGKARLTDKVGTSEHAWSMGGSQIYLAQGEEMSLKDMLISVAVGSANDASVAVAEHLAGSEEAFVADMNERARALGCTDTHFANATGLPAPEHYTSALDMARIMRAGLAHPLFMELSGIKEYDLRGGRFKLWNTNKLLWWYKGTDAGKTGWTSEAAYCLAASAERDGLRLVAVVLGTPGPKSHFRETMRIFNYGFARYRAVNLAGAGEKIRDLKVDKGHRQTVPAVTGDWVTMVVPRGEEKGFESRVELPAAVKAPVRRGSRVGSYTVLKKGREVLRVPLVAAYDVGRAGLGEEIWRTMQRVYGEDKPFWQP